MKTAVLYQKNEPPIIDGIKKPMKPGGYRDSGADIAYCLKGNGAEIATPVKNPDVYNDLDWVFPDTREGIDAAIRAGADTLWLNTVLYKGHPITEYSGIYVVGHRADDVEMYDDKLYTNGLLMSHGLPVVKSTVLGENDKYEGGFPCVIKPIRGRGSQGVVRCYGAAELERIKKLEISEGIYGTRLMAEKYLSGNEITVTVFPNGRYLPPVERFNQIDGIAPYNGKVAVTKNSRAVKNMTAELTKICEACSEAVRILNLKALCRIDCRADETGKYYMFDFNPKPNMTGASRPHRQDKDSLVMMAAREENMTFYDLLCEMLKTRWKL